MRTGMASPSPVSSVAPAAAAGARGVVTDPERAIGDILVSRGALSADLLSKALRIQLKLEEWKPLGAILVDLGMLSRATVEDAIKESRRALSIEEILVQRGTLHPDQLAAAVTALGGRRRGIFAVNRFRCRWTNSPGPAHARRDKCCHHASRRPTRPLPG